MCHGILERTAKGEIEPFEMLDEYELGFATDVTEAFPPNSFVDLQESYYNDGYSFFESFPGFDDMKVLGVEEDFKIEMEHPDSNYTLRGIVDLLYENERGELIVRDWKSKSKFANKQEQAKYARQLYSYAEYIKRSRGVFPTAMEFYMFRKQKVVKVPFVASALEETINWMNGVVSAIRNEKDWMPKYDDWFCGWLCDQRDDCPFRVNAES